MDTGTIAAVIGAIAAVIGAIVAVMAVFVGRTAVKTAGEQLRRTENIAHVQAILAFDGLLSPFEEIRRMLNKMKDDNKKISDHDDRIEFRRYIAVWERLDIMIERGTVTPETIDKLYGSRFKYLFKAEDTLRNIVVEKATEWPIFISLWRIFYNYKNNVRDLPSPPESNHVLH